MSPDRRNLISLGTFLGDRTGYEASEVLDYLLSGGAGG